MNKKFLFLFLFFLFLPCFSFAADVVSLNSNSLNLFTNQDFSVTARIDSTADLYSVNFDLNFNGALVDFVDAVSGNSLFLQNCGVAPTITYTPPASGLSKIVFSIIRGCNNGAATPTSADIVTFSFRTKSTEGTATLNFSNQSLYAYSGARLDYPNTQSHWPSPYAASLSIAVLDTTAPARSSVTYNGGLTTTFPSSTTQVAAAFSTNENATCKYSASPGVIYNDMPVNQAFTFSGGTQVGGTSHSVIFSGLSSGTYTYYARCRDVSANVNLDDYVINFSIASAGAAVVQPDFPIKPTITSYSVTKKRKASAVISWETSGPCSGYVIYGTSKKSIKKKKISNIEAAEHSLKLSKLKKNKTYYYRIVCQDSGKTYEVKTAVKKFKTKKR